jgi:hypothetical protein
MTKGIFVKTNRGNYVLSDPELGLIQNEDDILEMLTLFEEVGSNGLLLTSDSLDPNFFDLSTGMAGEIVLKLSTYRIKTAIVVDLNEVHSERFKEWVFECNRGQEIHFASEFLEAEDWLLENQTSKNS